jgi:hypothetical protein
MTRWCEPDSGREFPDDNAGADRMRADLARLEAAFPAFSFAIRRGLRGFTFEAWRVSMAAGLYAVITADPGELWRELVTGGAAGGSPGRAGPAATCPPAPPDSASR